jgi:hypothetical protein
MNIFLKLLFFWTISFFSQAYANSCHWTEQFKYPDGSIGCFADLPFANEIIKEEKKSVIQYLSGSTTNAVAVSNIPGCKALGVSSVRIEFNSHNHYYNSLERYNKIISDQPKIAMNRCKKQGCECEIVIVDSVSKTDKRSLFAKVTGDFQKDDDQIASLRKELEKEISSRLLAEEILKNSSQNTAVPVKVVPPPRVFANRKALVIGNDSYQKISKLSNAREDAKVIAEGLTSVGYTVQLKLDVTEKQFKSELRNFKNIVQAGDEVAIFYAGHGVQVASTNYLLPIDIGGQNEEEVKDEGIAVQRLLDDMRDKGAKFTLAMIDACRDNPFQASGRGIGGGTRGLSPTTAATGQMVVFSAGSGQQALDKLGPTDKSKNGLFTRVFVEEMQKPGISVDRVVRNVRSRVVELAKSVGHNQVPAIYDQVVGDFYFRQ